MPKDPNTRLDEYAREIESDTSIDVTNILEKQFSSPNTKHKWLYRLAKEKRELLKMVDEKDSYLSQIMNKDNPLRLSKAAISNKLDSQEDYKKLQKTIKEQEILVEYLENSVNKIFSQMGYDFKNLVDLMKMEQL
jgi:predicted transcriptional regulator